MGVTAAVLPPSTVDAVAVEVTADSAIAVAEVQIAD